MIKHTINNSDISFELKPSAAQWASSASEELLPLAAKILENCSTFEIDIGSSSITLPNDAISTWPETVAMLAGLPQNCPFGLDLRLSSGLGQPGTTLSMRWLKPGTSLPLSTPPSINGLIVNLGEKQFRLHDPFFTVIKLTDSFNEAGIDDPQEQLRIWSHIRNTLGEENVTSVTDNFLRVLKVATADSFTFNYETDANGDIQVVPVLLTKDYSNNGNGSTKNRVLLETEDEAFTKRLDDLPEGASSFPLANGTYVVVDEKLQKALAAVRKIRQSPPAERKRVFLKPEAIIAEMLGEDPDSNPENSIFVETEKYSERVLDLAEWVPPVVPWIKVQSQSWLPTDSCGFRVGAQNVPIEAADIPSAIDAVKEAINTGNPTAVIANVPVPANQATLDSLTSLQKTIADRKSGKPPKTGGPSNPTSAPKVLVIETNFIKEFSHSNSNKRPGSYSLPDTLKTNPKPHQIDGLKWLISHWTNGSSGCLLADDMGLGKTYQALAFLAWLKEQMDAGKIEKRPILIVAPVGLLKNWEGEHNLHLSQPGLGEVLLAYGEHLKFLRKGSHSSGSANLDNARLNSADWILANYEAVSDYQLNFGAIKFACVIFDEAQKIKTPSARMTHACKGLNAEFLVAMTGTPVENRLADLWCIADTVQPLVLGTLREFSAKHESPDSAEAIKSLRENIWQKEEAIESLAPLLMLRRLKGEKLTGLPKKHEHHIKREMPQAQIDAYTNIVENHFIKGPQGTLGTIQALRSASLHPSIGNESFDINQSARFQVAFEILDKCNTINEKALVFLESLDLQAADQIPLLIMQRYNLKKLPMVINGEIDALKRQKRVDEFQASKDFDVMILSPKAGGVGITLTAANHVIHLSRWWNPAVEDQCSDRVYRIGQTKDVHVYYPLAIYPADPDNSFDVKLDALMTRKRNLSQQLLAPPIITKDDYDELLKSVQR
jgi:SNF2 family DNA or RNA helicase